MSAKDIKVDESAAVDAEVADKTVHDVLAEYLAEARLGGSEKNRTKIKESGKMLVRERLAHLFDDEDHRRTSW